MKHFLSDRRIGEDLRVVKLCSWCGDISRYLWSTDTRHDTDHHWRCRLYLFWINSSNICFEILWLVGWY